MKQWMKYMAVACGFLVMAIVCFPNKGNQVSAEGTTSGNTVQVEEENTEPVVEEKEESVMPVVTSWTLTIEYKLAGGAWNKTESDIIKSTIAAGSGGSFTFKLTEEIPTKTSYKFLGWKCEKLGNETLNYENELTYDSMSEAETITFTALWEQETTPDEGENEGDGTESGFLAEGATPTNGENKLKANIKYILGSGTWTVNSTPTIYEGGSEFYVEADGTYTFSQISQSQ